MAVPDSYAVTILVETTDVTTYAPYDKMTFEDCLLDVSSFRFMLENPPFTPLEGMRVSVYRADIDNVPAIFNGIILEPKAVKRGVVLDYEIEAHDQKVYLQKSVIGYGEFEGDDLTVLEDMLAATYPDLTDRFDFESDVESFVSDLNLSLNNQSLLDGLKKFRDKTGATLNFERDPVLYSIKFDGTDIIDEYVSRYPAYTFGAVTSPLPTFEGVTTGGNPGNCFKSNGSGALTTLSEYIPFTIFLRNPSNTPYVRFVSITFDVWFDFNGQDCFITADDSFGDTTLPAASSNQWVSVDYTTLVPSGFPFDGKQIQITLRPAANMASGAWQVRLDNIRLKVINPRSERLKMLSIPDPAAFDIDIPTSPEFATKLDFTQGSLDSFNSVTVIGGNEAYAIDWIYGADGAETHFGLETFIKDMTVYKNSGSDVTPSWTTQTSGIFGTDELFSGGGLCHVLYDAKEHFLLFNSAPVNLTKAFRVTGTIEKPIRVRVENAGEDDEIFATTVFDDTVKTEDDAVLIGNAALNSKANQKKMNFGTHHPGLFVGAAMTVTDASRDLDETLVIQKITTTWLGASGHAFFDVECGNTEQSNLATSLAEADSRSRPRGAMIDLPITTIASLLDEDSMILTDEDGVLLEDD